MEEALAEKAVEGGVGVELGARGGLEILNEGGVEGLDMATGLDVGSRLGVLARVGAAALVLYATYKLGLERMWRKKEVAVRV